MISAEVERNVRWVLTFAEKTPQVAIEAVGLTRSAGAQLIEVTVANVGWMATATAHAVEELGIARPVRARLQLNNAELVSGDGVVDLGVLQGTRLGAAESRVATWSARVLDGERPASATIIIESEKAGTLRRTVTLTTGR